MDTPAILAEGLYRSFGSVEAVRDVNLTVPAGTVFGLLGPNGAGKTTTVRILTTLLRPDRGRAVVAGFDIVKDAEKVRSAIGLTGQFTAIDDVMTGRENLEMVGRLYHLGKKESRKRADELLERFGLTDAGMRMVKTYSGGMRRRLDLGASLIGHPAVLFLDEPTTGLDPVSRIELWKVIEELVSEGTTLLLTTQYLEEADRLAKQIAVIDHGTVIALGTSRELKDRIGGDVIAISLSDPSRAPDALVAIKPLSNGDPHFDESTLTVTAPVAGGTSVLMEGVRLLDAAGIPVVDIAMRRPTLDDVFFSLTGHRAEENTIIPTKRSRRKK